jgi:hypothetical protein
MVAVDSCACAASPTQPATKSMSARKILFTVILLEKMQIAKRCPKASLTISVLS